MSAPHLRLLPGGLYPVALKASKRSFLLLHQKGLTDEQLASIQHAAMTAILPWCGGQPFTVTTAKQDWQANFDRFGGWDGWINGVVGRDFSSAEWRYTGFIAAGPFQGSATARIIKLALERGAAVVVLHEGRLYKATSVVHLHDYQWQVMTA